MAPPPPCRLPRSLPPWLLLLLSVALLGVQARAEPAAGSAVPAQSTCVAEGPRGPDSARVRELRACPLFPAPTGRAAPWVGGARVGLRRGRLPCTLTLASVGRPCVDCHAFEFMQRALQDLRKTAYSLDSRTETLLLQAERRALCACWPSGR
uniref:NELL2-interacting cell ontogeny regulator 1 n=2 Tax=Canis lupus TaxID=9612 RepID=A0A8P0T4W5_CANLF